MIQDRKREVFNLHCLLGVLFLYLFYVAYNAEIPFDAGDGIMHYMISRFSWRHPELFLHLWGKPFFTLVSSPFAQFGQTGINTFQIFCALSTSYFCYRIAEKLNLQFALLLPIFICFSPIYFAAMNSGLTEPFFGSVLMFSVWMFFKKKYMLAAIVVSFLPFIRSEAYVVLPLIALLLLVRKQFFSLVLLGSGTIIYSLIGYFYNGDIFWLIHQNQNLLGDNYPGAKGELLHYVKHYDDFLGAPLAVLVLLGLLAGIIYAYRFFFTSAKPLFFAENLSLIYGSFFACLILHALLFWLPETLNNLGMMRYMVTLIPSAALISLHGINLIFSIPVMKYSWRNALISSVFSFFIINSAIDRWYFPFKIGGEEKVIKNVGEWYKASGLQKQKIYYMHNFLPFSLGADPFDNKQLSELYGLDKEHPENNVEENSIIIWDAHYGPNEKKIELETLLRNPNFIVLNHFSPEQEFKVLGDRNFEVYVFQRKGNL